MRQTISICCLTGSLALSLAAAFCPGHAVVAGSSAKNRGAELFSTKGCAHCHGPAGVGGGKGPDLQLVRKRRDREAIITQIHDGGKSMPPFGDELSPQEIGDLAAFLTAKRKVIALPPKPAGTPLPPAVSQDSN